MAISGLDHINIDTCKPEQTLEFYTEVLGLENHPERRPDSDSPGAWLWADGRAVVHLNFVDEDDRFTGQRSAFNHIAFQGSDFDGMCRLLESRSLDYRTSAREEIGLRQIFVHDPNGVRCEINVQS